MIWTNIWQKAQELITTTTKGIVMKMIMNPIITTIFTLEASKIRSDSMKMR